MTPYYKLPKNWAKSNQHYVLFGPDGLSKNQLLSELKNQYKHIPQKHIRVNDNNDIQNLITDLVSPSLFDDAQFIMITISDNQLKNFPWALQKNPNRIIILTGPEKPPKSIKHIESFGQCIRTYALKEPFLSRTIQNLASNEKLKLTQKSIKWIALSHLGEESLIPQTLKKLSLIFGTKSVSDEEIRSCLQNTSNVSLYEAIDALSSNGPQLKLFISKQHKSDWPKVFWLLASYWRKVVDCSDNPKKIGEHFPWESQKKQVIKILNNLSKSQIASQHSQLIAIEPSLKGIEDQPYPSLITHWLLQTQTAINR